MVIIPKASFFLQNKISFAESFKFAICEGNFHNSQEADKASKHLCSEYHKLSYLKPDSGRGDSSGPTTSLLHIPFCFHVLNVLKEIVDVGHVISQVEALSLSRVCVSVDIVYVTSSISLGLNQ